jgi:hypothetical protein
MYQLIVFVSPSYHISLQEMDSDSPHSKIVWLVLRTVLLALMISGVINQFTKVGALFQTLLLFIAIGSARIDHSPSVLNFLCGHRDSDRIVNGCSDSAELLIQGIVIRGQRRRAEGENGQGSATCQKSANVTCALDRAGERKGSTEKRRA